MASTFEELFRATRHSAFHLEMRDGYEQDEAFREWQGGDRFDPAERWPWWVELVSSAVARGVDVRRARVVSEPVSAYVRYEYDLTSGHNVKAGEAVRWLPRGRASALLLPGNDLWLFDRSRVLFNRFDGVGTMTGEELVTTPDVVSRCADSFDAVWDVATPHEEYVPS